MRDHRTQDTNRRRTHSILALVIIMSNGKNVVWGPHSSESYPAAIDHSEHAHQVKGPSNHPDFGNNEKKRGRAAGKCPENGATPRQATFALSRRAQKRRSRTDERSSDAKY